MDRPDECVTRSRVGVVCASANCKRLCRLAVQLKIEGHSVSSVPVNSVFEQLSVLFGLFPPFGLSRDFEFPDRKHFRTDF